MPFVHVFILATSLLGLLVAGQDAQHNVTTAAAAYNHSLAQVLAAYAAAAYSSTPLTCVPEADFVLVDELHVVLDTSIDPNRTLAGFVGYQNRTDGSIIVSFRGTDDPAVQLDAEICMSGPSAYLTNSTQRGLAVTYFKLAVDLFRPQLLGAIEAARLLRPNATVFFTGHSLGAAIAALFTYEVREHYGPLGNGSYQELDMHLYTFGEPRVGDSDTADAIWNATNAQAYRVVHYGDIVPHLPFCHLQPILVGQCSPDKIEQLRKLMRINKRFMDAGGRIQPQKGMGSVEQAMDRLLTVRPSAASEAQGDVSLPPLNCLFNSSILWPINSGPYHHYLEVWYQDQMANTTFTLCTSSPEDTNCSDGLSFYEYSDTYHYVYFGMDLGYLCGNAVSGNCEGPGPAIVACNHTTEAGGFCCNVDNPTCCGDSGCCGNGATCCGGGSNPSCCPVESTCCNGNCCQPGKDCILDLFCSL